MSNIFAEFAPLYWDRALRVIPIHPGSKKPALGLKGWQGNLAAVPSHATQEKWIEKYFSHGLGLLLGLPIEDSDTILTGLDIDDDRMVRAVRSYVMSCNDSNVIFCGKRGKKGMTIFVRAEKSQKSRVIAGENGLGNIDFLSSGKMTVMPPTIHPETNLAYENLGSPLLETDLGLLPLFTGKNLSVLQILFSSPHTSAILEGKATHDAGLALVATLCGATTSDTEIEAIIRGLLPEDYDGNSISELPGWISSAREKFVKEDAKQQNNGAQALINLALEKNVVLFNDGDGETYCTLPPHPNCVAYLLSSSKVKLWMRRQAHVSLGKPISSHPLNEAIATMQSFALFDGEVRVVHARTAGDNTKVIVDLGNDNFAHIDRNGWGVSNSSPHMFIRGAGFEALPIPLRGADLDLLQHFLHLDDTTHKLLLAFLINAMKPTGPYFVLMVEGEQGSGKSFFCEIIKRIIDPNRAPRLRLPDKPQDLMIQAKEYRLLNFDNASGIRADMSDALCSLSTGGGLAVRKLYTDAELSVLSYSRPFVVNGISGYANRPDLMERAIPIKLQPMGDGMRKSEAELNADFDKLLPEILGALFEAVSQACFLHDEIDPPRNLRMADAARWIMAAEQGLGERGLISTIAQSQDAFVVDRINDDPLVLCLRTAASKGPFVGYVGELYVEIMRVANGNYGRSLPQSPSMLSKQLDRLKPALKKAGIDLEFLPKDKRGKKIRVTCGESTTINLIIERLLSGSTPLWQSHSQRLTSIVTVVIIVTCDFNPAKGIFRQYQAASLRGPDNISNKSGYTKGNNLCVA